MFLPFVSFSLKIWISCRYVMSLRHAKLFVLKKRFKILPHQKCEVSDFLLFPSRCVCHVVAFPVVFCPIVFPLRSLLWTRSAWHLAWRSCPELGLPHAFMAPGGPPNIGMVKISKTRPKKSTTTKQQKSWSEDKESESGPLQNPTVMLVDFWT